MIIRTARTAGLIAAVLAIGAVGIGAQNGSLPDRDDFLAEVRSHLRSDRLLLSQYTYLEKRTPIRMSPLGKVSADEVRTYQVYPSLEEGLSYRRLIAVNGEPVSDAALQKQDREHRERVLKHTRRLEREGLGERERRLRKEREERRKEDETTDELFKLYDMQLTGRELIDDHPTIVVSFSPRADYKPRTDDGKTLKKMKGTAWVSELDYEIVRVEAEAVEDIKFGLGLVGRLHKGSRASFQRRKVNDEIWLPAFSRISASGRGLFFRRFQVETVTEYSDYKKFNVETSTAIDLPPPPD